MSERIDRSQQVEQIREVTLNDGLGREFLLVYEYMDKAYCEVTIFYIKKTGPNTIEKYLVAHKEFLVDQLGAMISSKWTKEQIKGYREP